VAALRKLLNDRETIGGSFPDWWYDHHETCRLCGKPVTYWRCWNGSCYLARFWKKKECKKKDEPVPWEFQ